MSDRQSGILLSSLILVCLVGIRPVDSKSASDIETYYRFVEREGEPRLLSSKLRSDTESKRKIRSAVNLDVVNEDDDDDDRDADPNQADDDVGRMDDEDEISENQSIAVTTSYQDEAGISDGNVTSSPLGKRNDSEENKVNPKREREFLFNTSALEGQGLPDRFLIGSRKSFELVCPQRRRKPRVYPRKCVKLTENPVFHHRYLLDVVGEFLDERCVGLESVTLECVSVDDTPEYFHLNVSFRKVPLVYAPMNAKAKWAKVANPPPGCGSTRVQCTVQANPPANLTLKRVILDEDDKVASYEDSDVPEKCVTRDFESSKATFYTPHSGPLACAATNEHGSYGVWFRTDGYKRSKVTLSYSSILVYFCFGFFLYYVVFECVIPCIKCWKPERESAAKGPNQNLGQSKKKKKAASKLTINEKDIAKIRL